MSATPWLPQPEDWKSYTAEADQADHTSMLQLYRSALRLRRTNPHLRSEDFRWLDSPADTLLFERGNSLLCAINLSDQPIPLPHTAVSLLASGPLGQGRDVATGHHCPAAPKLRNGEGSIPADLPRAPSALTYSRACPVFTPRRSDRPWFLHGSPPVEARWSCRLSSPRRQDASALRLTCAVGGPVSTALVTAAHGGRYHRFITDQ
ncbi:DUF3459 domain-containing protein [Streptomyces sp. NPDC005474]|uniref:DUF3459 domain-containing protein n=1 Tax=Streptomyces sp. NPDC005474 TaxID=3154878 RepID=UPI0034555D54